jgi:uncharacterized protein
MTQLPEVFRAAWEAREDPLVFTTTDGNGTPNTIFVTCIRLHDDSTILVADNYFDKTRRNIRGGGTGSVLFITDERKAFQVKGPITYHTDGTYHAFMLECLEPKYPVVGVVALKIEEIYTGAERLL